MNFALRPSRDAATARYITALSNNNTYFSPFQYMISCDILVYVYLNTKKKINFIFIFKE
jgi:hypothetical protein